MNGFNLKVSDSIPSDRDVGDGRQPELVLYCLYCIGTVYLPVMMQM